MHTIQKDKEYPHVLLVTADHDDRVVPSHSYKYIAELQHVNGNQEKPFLIRIDTKSGHGAGKPTTKIVCFLIVFFYENRIISKLYYIKKDSRICRQICLHC